jgi:hypothetical protein
MYSTAGSWFKSRLAEEQERNQGVRGAATGTSRLRDGRIRMDEGRLTRREAEGQTELQTEGIFPFCCKFIVLALPTHICTPETLN